jgi:autotransporter-associated beta strand protein
VEQLRVSQSGAAQSEVHLDEGGLIAVHQLRMDNASTGLFAFNGGCLQATKEDRAFYEGAAASWTNVAFTVGEKGAGFDLSNGINLWWGKPLTSGAATDGGLFKKGSGILVLTSANAYNGPTVIESGRIQARVDNAIPAGTTLRLGGGADTRFTASTYDSENPRRDTAQTIARVEGSGELDDMGASSVTGAIAPSVDGIINFMTTCALSGDYEVSVNATTNSLLVLKGANQDISGLQVKVMNPAALNSDADRDTYKILDAPNGYEGHFRLADDFLGNKWNVRYESGAAYLSPVRAFVIIMR